MNRIIITSLAFQDIPQVARLHKTELPGFLSQLGEAFLEKFYRASLSIPELFTLISKENEQILGFVTLTTNISDLYKKIIFRDVLGFSFLFLNYFITHPQKLLKAIRIFAYPGFKEDIPELLTIAIGSQYQKQGLGRGLFEEAVREFKKKGVKKFRVSVYDSLAANGFYRKMGCKLESSFMFLGEKMNYYTFNI